MPKLYELKKFPIYDIHERKIFQRGKMYKFDYAFKKQALEHFNIGMVITFAPAIPDENFQKLDDERFIDYYYNPIPDGILKDSTIEDLAALIRKAVYEITVNKFAVLSHCNAGRNRSGLFSALLVRELTKCSGNEAVEIVRRERPRAIDNDYFESYLRSLK